MMQKICLAPSLSQVFPSRIRELADIAFSMDGVLRLHFGESNLSTPGFIKAAAVQAMNKGYTFYTENAGLPSQREAIAEKYTELHQVNLNFRIIYLDWSSHKKLFKITLIPIDNT